MSRLLAILAVLCVFGPAYGQVASGPGVTIQELNGLFISPSAVAATYLKQSDASTIYIKASAAVQTFLPLAGGVMQGPFLNSVPGNSAAAAAAFQNADKTGLVQIFPADSAGGSGDFPVNSLIQAGDAAIVASNLSGALPCIVYGVATVSATAGAIRICAGPASAAMIDLGVRPVFAGNLAWDVGNLPAPISDTAGVACIGTPTDSFATDSHGIVTHC
jgi:hypothetical protein